MRLFFFVLLQLFISMSLISGAAETAVPINQKNIIESKITEARKTAAAEAYGKLPLYFIENKGQVDKAVKFYERGAGHTTFFTENGVVLALTKTLDTTKKKENSNKKTLNDTQSKKSATEVLRLSFLGTNKNSSIIASDPQQGRVNYFTGSDRSKWRSNISTYRTLTYKNIYDNIDIKFYGSNRDIEHDIIVHPGGDLLKARFVYKGAEGLEINKDGDLEISLAKGVLIEKRPFIYQEVNGQRKSIDGSYRILKSKDGAFEYGYEVASYDHTKALVIDPVLTYSTYLGGSDWDVGNDIAVDASGAAYVTGDSYSMDFPLYSLIEDGSSGALPANKNAFITKFSPSGKGIVYSTYIGGNNSDSANSIAVDSSGAVYITGQTISVDFPLMNPIQGAYIRNSDAFITKINPAGSALVYSTYLSGFYSDNGTGIAVDSSGAAYVTGTTSSTDFPVVNPFQGTLGGVKGFPDAFVTKINPQGSAYVYSTYLGGGETDYGYGITVDALGAAYVTGQTLSTDFPLMNPAQGTFGGGLQVDAFITKIDPTGSALTYSTYLGGNMDDSGFAIAIDDLKAAYVTGRTNSGDFPLINPIQSSFNYSFTAFVTKLSPDGSAFIYSTYLGGNSDDKGVGITVNSNREPYITGHTRSSNFPLVHPIQDTNMSAHWDAFVTKINSAGSAYLFSTYLGSNGSSSQDSNVANGIALDNAGAIYITGSTSAKNFPLVNPLQGIYGGGISDAYISKISDAAAPVVTLAITPEVTYVAEGSTLHYNVTATNTTNRRQCFDYWENMSLQDNSTYPATGELFGPVNRCLNAGASQTTPLAHTLPMGAPLGGYALNAFAGAYGTSANHILVSEAHFSFWVTAPAPAASAVYNSWSLIENGFK